MRRKSVLVRSLIALAAATALPGTAAAAELPALPQPVIQQPKLPQLPDVQKDLKQLEQDAYDALPKELHNSPVFAGSSRPVEKPAESGKQRSQSVADATCSNCVAITYDDGPGEVTDQLLDTLKAKDAHASFMVLAPSASTHPELLRRMKAEGHTVGNHTASHRELNKLSPSDVDGEIKAGAAAIKAATGENPRGCVPRTVPPTALWRPLRRLMARHRPCGPSTPWIGRTAILSTSARLQSAGRSPAPSSSCTISTPQP